MPEEPRGGQGGPRDENPSEADLDAELTEFEAALKKQVEESRREPMVDDPPLLDAPPGGFPSEEEIEARLSRAIKDAEAYWGPTRHDSLGKAEEERTPQESEEPEDTGVHAEFSDRLNAFDARSRKAKAAKDAHSETRRKIGASDGDSARGLGVGLSAAYAIIGCPLLGAGIGYLVDRSSGSNVGTTIGVVAGTALGMLMAILILNRFNDR